MERFFESVGNFFTGGDNIPWCDRDLIAVSALGTFPSAFSPPLPSESLQILRFCCGIPPARWGLGLNRVLATESIRRLGIAGKGGWEESDGDHRQQLLYWGFKGVMTFACEHIIVSVMCPF